jgi:hypothetical protein
MGAVKHEQLLYKGDMGRLLQLAAMALIFTPPSSAQYGGNPWQSVQPEAYVQLADDDIDRHLADADFFHGISVSERRFSENGFNWHLIRFENAVKADGPLWVVPHDDENAAFDAMIAAIKTYGGVGIAVNSGPGSARRQSGYGRCGIYDWVVSSCDPNRNFDLAAPIFAAAFLYDYQPGQPIIALHTNSPGFGGDGHGGRGDITILDGDAYVHGETRPREGGHFGSGTVALLNDPDVYAIMPYYSAISARDIYCRGALNTSGVHVWHERVDESDGSLSNFLAINRRDIAYVNMEAKKAADLATAIEAQRLMIAAYMANCVGLPRLWDLPPPLPSTAE